MPATWREKYDSTEEGLGTVGWVILAIVAAAAIVALCTWGATRSIGG